MNHFRFNCGSGGGISGFSTALRRRKGTVSGIHLLMDCGAMQSVRIMHKDTFDKLVVEQPWAIDELVDHAGGKRFRIGFGFRFGSAERFRAPRQRDDFKRRLTHRIRHTHRQIFVRVSRAQPARGSGERLGPLTKDLRDGRGKRLEGQMRISRLGKHR